MLVHYLREHSEHLSVNSVSHDASDVCLQALVSLCKISKSRQEQAVLAGVVPLLQKLIFNKDFRGRDNAFQMMCAFPNTSNCARFYLTQQRGVSFFVSCLSPGQQTESQFKTHALEALVHWLSGDGDVQCCLLQKQTRPQFFLSLTNLVETTTDEGLLQKNLDLLVKMVTISESINKSIGCERSFVHTIVRRIKTRVSHDMLYLGEKEDKMDSLSHSESQKWILSKVGVRIDGIHAMGSLVRLLKCICEKHGHLARLCRDHHLHSLLRMVLWAERRRGRVMLEGMATQLLDSLPEIEQKCNSDQQISIS